MGVVAQVVGDAFEFAGDAVQSVGNIASDAVREIGRGAESLGREIGKIGQAAINDPVGTIAKVAAVATQQYWALPVISATTVVANGGDLGQAAMAAGISYAGMYIASGISDYLSSGSESALAGVSKAADGSTIFSYTDGSTMIQTLDGLTKFTNPTTITGALNTAISNAAGNIATTALRGGDLNQILTAGLTGGAGTYVGLESTQALKNLGLAAPIANVLGSTSGAVTKGVLSGQDAGEVFNTALINNIIDTSLAQTGNAIKNTDVYKTLQKAVNEKVNDFKTSFNEAKDKFLSALNSNDELVGKSKAEIDDILEQSNSVKSQAEKFRDESLTPAQQAAQKAADLATSSYNSYKSKSDEFSRLVAQYDQAKADNNYDLANSLADQANALIPSLNAATDKYNTDYTSYENARNDFDTKNKTYLTFVDQLKNLDSRYTTINKALETQAAVTKEASQNFNAVYDQIQNATKTVSEEVKTAYQTASEYSPIAANTFNELYSQTGDLTRASNLSQQVNALPENNQKMFEFAKEFGLRPEDAIQFAPDISKMSVVATQAFFDSLAENPDADVALETANRINSLSKPQQNAFFEARIKGLDTERAITFADVAGTSSKEQQEAYLNALKSGLGEDLATLISSAYALAPSPKTALQDINQANLAKLETPQQKEAYYLAVSSGMRPMDALSEVLDFFVPSAQAGTMPYVGKTPEGKDLVESVYRQDPVTGKWGEYIPDGKGGYVNTGAVLVGSYSEGPTGDKYVVDKTSDQNGIPNLSMTPYRGPNQTPAQTAGQFQSTKEQLDKELAEGQITATEYDAAIKNVKPATPIVIPQEKAPTIQDWVNELFTGPQSAKKIATTGAGGTTIGTTTSGTGTGTTGGAGTGTTGGAGTTTGGTGTGTTAGTGATTSGATTTGGAGGTTTTTGGAGGTAGTGAGAGGTGGGGTGTGGGGAGFGIGGIGGGGFMLPGSLGMFGLLGSQDAVGGIRNLTPGLTERMEYNLSGLPSDQDVVNPLFNAPQIIQPMATGGSTSTYDPFSTKDITGGSAINPSLTPGLTRAQLNYILTGVPEYLQGRAEGGHIEGHNPQFYSEGGLSAIENRFVKGEGDGTSDSIPAMLADGEFVIPADVVSSLGNGSNDAGAGVLDEFLKVIREHKRKADAKNLPEDSKGPLAYLIDAQRRAKA